MSNGWGTNQLTPLKMPTVSAPLNPHASRRKFPRRLFEKTVGILYRGKYTMEQSSQLSEGGMGILASMPDQLKVGESLVVTFLLPGQEFIIARAEVRDVRPPNNQNLKRISMMFIDFGFYPRRKVREYISAKGPNEPDV